MNFKRGQRYLVQYRLDGQRKDRVFVGDYVGWNAEREHIFSLRPSAGDVRIPGDALRLSQETIWPNMQPAEAEKFIAKQLAKERPQ